MSTPYDPNSGTPLPDSSSQYPQYPQYGAPTTPNQPIPPTMPPYLGPPPAGYPAAPQGYPYPYGSYPPPYAPPGYPAPPPRNNTTLWVILGIVGVVVIGCCVGCAILLGGVFNFAGRIVSSVQPVITAQSFCDDVVKANYSAAYGLLSPTLQASITQADFVSQSTARDASEGAVTVCDVNVSSLGGITSSSTSATVDVRMTRKLVGDFGGTVTLVKNDSMWTIDTIDPALPILTDGTPLPPGTATPDGYD